MREAPLGGFKTDFQAQRYHTCVGFRDYLCKAYKKWRKRWKNRDFFHQQTP